MNHQPPQQKDDSYKLLTKPHGHGDIHALLHKQGISKKWEDDFGIKYLVIFQVSLTLFLIGIQEDNYSQRFCLLLILQDTNGLAFNALPLMLGVSEKRGFIMNSLTIPRKAKQAVGGIAKLRNEKTGEER